MFNTRVPIGNLIVTFNEKTSTNNQLPVATSARCGLVMQSDYYQDGRISKRDNIGSNIAPNGSVTYRNRSDDGTFYFNVNNMGQDVCVSKFYPVFFVKEDIADRDYLVAKINSLQRSFAELAVGTSQKVLSLTLLKSIEIDLPSIENQRKIAATLSTWDRAIELHDRLIALKEKQKKGLMQQLLTGKKRLLDDNGVPFSGEWSSSKLGDVADIDSESLGNKTPMDYEFDYVSISDVVTGEVLYNQVAKIRFSDAPSRARRIVRNGDTLFSTVRPNLKAVAHISTHVDNMIASTGFAIVRPKDGVCGAYLYHYLLSNHVDQQIEALVSGSNYPAINSSDVKSIRLKIPSLEYQRKIAAALNAAEAEVKALKRKRHLLYKQKQGLMQQLLA